MEVFNRYLKYGVKAFQSANCGWDKGLRDLIKSYRATPLEGGKSPAAIFFGHPIRTDHQPNQSQPTRWTVQEQRKARMEIPQLREHKPKIGIYKKGDLVLSKLPHMPKGRSPYLEPKTVRNVLGFYMFLLSDGYVWNARKLKPFIRETPDAMDVDERDGGRAENPPDDAPVHGEREPPVDDTPPVPRRRNKWANPPGTPEHKSQEEARQKQPSTKRGRWCASEEHTRSFDTHVSLGRTTISFLILLVPVNGCFVAFWLNSTRGQEYCGDVHNSIFRRHLRRYLSLTQTHCLPPPSGPYAFKPCF
ncbi:MAG: hypothetical protein GY696_33425 [Gammaproteobacteria bacterium]|nr:hypothetical protein [Gammaproteobacteria bacterium]